MLFRCAEEVCLSVESMKTLQVVLVLFSVCKIVRKAWHYSSNRTTTQIACRIDSNRNNLPQRPF
jgi:hypothetical protein